jgi:hypothetical protein
VESSDFAVGGNVGMSADDAVEAAGARLVDQGPLETGHAAYGPADPLPWSRVSIPTPFRRAPPGRCNDAVGPLAPGAGMVRPRSGPASRLVEPVAMVDEQALAGGGFMDDFPGNLDAVDVMADEQRDVFVVIAWNEYDPLSAVDHAAEGLKDGGVGGGPDCSGTQRPEVENVSDEEDGVCRVV